MSKWFYIVCLGLILSSCGAEEQEETNEFNWTKQNSSELSENLAQQEEVDIEAYLIMRPEWEMIETGSGLRYFIYEEGPEDGPTPRSGQDVEIELNINLLDGTECYSTESDEVLILRVDRSEVESGIQESFKHLSEGDKAKLIVPSHLAHGLVGDMDKIPPLSVLVIDIHLAKVRS